MLSIGKGLAAGILSAFLVMSPALASEEEHAAEASYHVEEAVKHGGMGHAPMVADAAEKGLVHAKAAYEAGKSAHMKMVVEALEKAVEHGRMGHAEIATKHAKEALEHLKMVEEAQ